MKKKMTLDEFSENELRPVAEVVSFTNSVDTSVYADSTVVKSPEVSFRGMLFSKAESLSQSFLLNYRRSDADIGALIGIGNYSLPMVQGAVGARDIRGHSELIRLPPPKNVRAPIGSVMRSRRSIRKYSGRQITTRQLSSVLFYAQGVTGQHHLENVEPSITLGESVFSSFRAAPSGGGLHPIDLYVLSYRVSGLQKGAYRYLPAEHGLEPVDSFSKDTSEYQIAEFGKIEAQNAGFFIVYAYNLLENTRKYGDMGLAFAFVEVGQISENVHLICTALGLGSCDVGGFHKHTLEQALALDGLTQHVVLLTTIGA